MAVSFIVGKTLVPSEEIDELAEVGRFDRFSEGRQDAFTFRGASMTALEMSGPIRAVMGDGAANAPIGIGKPLTLQILSIYAGNAPQRGIFGGDPDVMAVSGVKGYETWDAQQRAINLVKGRVADREFVEFGAFDQGTPVVYYTPALVSSQTFCSFELVADSFDQPVFDQLSKLFGAAAGLPVFAPATGYLLAGSVILKLVGKLGQALFETDPFLIGELPIRFATRPFPDAVARFPVIHNERDRAIFANLEPALKTNGNVDRLVLVNPSDGQEYRGDAPYMITSLGGDPKPELKDFQAKLATAATLARFYRAEDPGGVVLEAVGTALELYNDLKFREKAESLMKTIAGMPDGSEEKEKAEQLLKAYLGNIKNELFKKFG